MQEITIRITHDGGEMSIEMMQQIAKTASDSVDQTLGYHGYKDAGGRSAIVRFATIQQKSVFPV